MIYLLAAIELPPGGSSTVHIYTQTTHRTTQNKQYIEQNKHFGRVRALPRLCGLYPGICLTTEEKAPKNLSQGIRRLPAGTMKIHKHTMSYYNIQYDTTITSTIKYGNKTTQTYWSTNCGFWQLWTHWKCFRNSPQNALLQIFYAYILSNARI